jgi:hypothetical protein
MGPNSLCFDIIWLLVVPPKRNCAVESDETETIGEVKSAHLYLDEGPFLLWRGRIYQTCIRNKFSKHAP